MPELVERAHRLLLVEDADRRALAALGRQGGDAQVDLRSSTLTLTRAVLGMRFSAMSRSLMIFTRETTPGTIRFGTRAAS